MIETILLARVRKTGAYVALSKAGDHWGQLKAALLKFDPEVHEEYDRVGLYKLEPQYKVLKLATKAEKAKADTQRAAHEAEFKKADTLAQAPIEELREIAAELKIQNVTKQTSRSELAAAILLDQKKGKQAPAKEAPASGEELVPSAP